MGVVETVRACVCTCTLFGVEAIPVKVEIEVGGGLPGMHVVGLADASVQESRERVRSAIRAAGFEMHFNRRIVVNLSPAHVRKSGTGFDLPIAVAYLIATGQIDPQVAFGTIIVGELSLSGAVLAVDGLFAYARFAHEQGMQVLSGPPSSSMPELTGLQHRCIDALGRLRSGEFDEVASICEPPVASCTGDFKDVVGQQMAIRALAIAAAGGHGMLMVGPPGAGKSMLARRLPSILPPLTEDERIQTAIIHSVAGLDMGSIVAGVRPFRSPHHSATTAALVGGGRSLRPGEASLAHNGVLFLDELGEFSSSSLQALRQPMEEGHILLCRAQGRALFPARFQLIAASNPCPCGYLGDKDHGCTCNEQQVSRYRSKLGGPIKDRIDLICEVERVDPAKVLDTGTGESSRSIAQRVLAARERALSRTGSKISAPMAQLTPHEAIEACGLTRAQRLLVENMARTHCLSGRGIIRVLRVARTIADLSECDDVSEDHLYEAFMYRVENTLERL